MELTRRQVDYLIAIYELGGVEKPVPPSKVALKLGVNKVTAVLIMKKLAKKKYVKYFKWKGAQLTKLGVLLAEKIIWRHRVLETLLFKYLALELEEACKCAKDIEYTTPDYLVAKICEKLGHPTTCPHGKPIPHPVCSKN
ncbi:MAG TPA: metal-dependent transcriptional regulator [Thermoproteales archaeon]|nr:metal-dependent transcriptional regulator [Thermoproteales archaeon]